MRIVCDSILTAICTVKLDNMNDLMQLDNLKSLANCTPLKKPLVLGNHSIKSVTVYNDMNVML